MRRSCRGYTCLYRLQVDRHVDTQHVYTLKRTRHPSTTPLNLIPLPLVAWLGMDRILFDTFNSTYNMAALRLGMHTQGPTDIQRPWLAYEPHPPRQLGKEYVQKESL